MAHQKLSPVAKNVLLKSINQMIKELDQEEWVRNQKIADACAKQPASPEQREFLADQQRQDALYLGRM